MEVMTKHCWVNFYRDTLYMLSATTFMLTPSEWLVILITTLWLHATTCAVHACWHDLGVGAFHLAIWRRRAATRDQRNAFTNQS